MDLYNDMKIIYKISNALGISPFKIEKNDNTIVFKSKNIMNNKLITLLYIFGVTSAIVSYVLGVHRTPILGVYKMPFTLTDNITNKILLYMTDCSGYVIVTLTYFAQFLMSKKIAKAVETLINIEEKMNQLENKTKLPNMKRFYVITLLIFLLDISLKLNDTINLAFNNNIPIHGVYEHFVRYFFITVMDIVIVQWICYMKILKKHFINLKKVLKRIKYKKCWIVSDFKVTTNDYDDYEIILTDIGVIYDQLCSVSSQINDYYSLPILFIIPTSFVIITFAIFSLCKIIKNNETVNPFMTIVYVSYLLRMMAFILSSISTMESAEDFIDKLLSIDVDSTIDSETTEIVSINKIYSFI